LAKIVFFVDVNMTREHSCHEKSKCGVHLSEKYVAKTAAKNLGISLSYWCGQIY